MRSDTYLQNQNVSAFSHGRKVLMFLLIITARPSTDAVTLTGSSKYAVPGKEFNLTCDVPEGANNVHLYRRPDSSPVGSIQVAGGQCYNIVNTSPTSPPVLCSPDVCSCTTKSTDRGIVFNVVIQPNLGDHGSVWFCLRLNPSLPNDAEGSPDFTLNLADGPGIVIMSPPDTTYTRTEGDTLPDITCTADCRPGCTFVWTKPDNTNFTASPMLSLGQLERSEHGTYRCTARNVVGESTTNVIITVLYGPGTVILSPPDFTYTKTEGGTLPDITCTADCRPGCTFVWTKPDNTNFTASAVFSLGQLDRSEHGTYRCTVRNVVEEVSTTFTINIMFGPDSVSITGNRVTVADGTNTLTLTCTTEEYNRHVHITWYNGTLQIPNTAVVTNTSGTYGGYISTQILQLTPDRYQDGNVIRCEVQNEDVTIGQQTASVKLNLRFHPDTDPIVSGYDGTTKYTGDTVTLMCTVVGGNPAASLSWTCPDGTTSSDGTVTVTLSNTFHGRTCSCTATHVVGGYSRTVSTPTFFVNNKPETLVKLVISQITSSSAVVSWEPGNEQDHFETFRLIYQKHGDPSITSVILNKTTTAFTIKQLLPSTKYDVSVFAINADETSDALSGTFITSGSASVGTGVALISAGTVMIILSVLVFAVTLWLLFKGRLPFRPRNKITATNATDNPEETVRHTGILKEVKNPTY